MPFVPRDNVEAAIQDAAECGAKFMESLGKSDLDTLTFDEWMTFVATICRQYDDSYDMRSGNQTEASNSEVENWSNSNPPKRSPGPSWDVPLRGQYRDLDDEIPF